MSAEHQPGSVVAGYRIDSVVGRGGMGVVYRAHDARLDRPVALKLIAPGLAKDPRFRERFLRESRLAASLEHPHILPVHTAGEADGALYLVMRYVEGEDLGARLRNGRLEPDEALSIVTEVASALDAAHARGLVHRDVKPGNVLLDTSGEAYLADFGLTKRVSSESALTATGEFVGTLDYLAPEQIEGRPVDGRADQYALACLCYESLAGTAPFKRESEAQTLWAHMRDPPPSLRKRRPELPVGIDEVLTRALAKEPANRYPNCTAFAQAARAALGLDVRVAAERRRRRGRVLLATGALVLAAAIAAAVVLATRNGAGSGAAPAPPPAEQPAPAEAPAEPAQAPAEQPTVVVEPNSVVVIDPDTNEIVDSVAVGSLPTDVAVGEGAVWVLNADDRTISRIDLANHRVRTIATGGTPTALAVGEGALWVEHTFDGFVSRIDPRTGVVEKRIELPNPPPPVEGFAGGAGKTGAAVGFGAVWVTGPARTESGSIPTFVWRIDPETNSVVASIEGLGGGPLTAGEEALWTIDVAGIEPRTNKVSRRIPFPFFVWDVAASDRVVWVLGDALFRLNESSAAVERTFAVGGDHLAADSGSVWVVQQASNELYRIDPASGSIEMIQLPRSPRDVAVGEGYVWVTVG